METVVLLLPSWIMDPPPPSLSFSSLDPISWWAHLVCLLCLWGWPELSDSQLYFPAFPRCTQYTRGHQEKFRGLLVVISGTYSIYLSGFVGFKVFPLLLPARFRCCRTVPWLRGHCLYWGHLGWLSFREQLLLTAPWRLWALLFFWNFTS